MTAFAHDFSWKAPAARARVFDALTEPAALRQWFAEHVEVERRVGGAFCFWGKHTIETPAKPQATQIITAYEPHKQFAFSWRLFGADSEVSFALAQGEKEDETAITGRHTFTTAPDAVRAKSLIDDLWMLNGGNFIAFLTGGDAMLLPDYDDPNPEIQQSILIDAPRSAVFKALITPALLAKWMYAEKPVVEPHIGGKYSYGWSYDVGGKRVDGGPTKILDYVENEKLVTDWPDWRGDASVPVQTITWLLADEGAKTRVTVIHSGFTRAVDFSDFPFGWADFLGGLKDIVEAA